MKAILTLLLALIPFMTPAQVTTSGGDLKGRLEGRVTSGMGGTNMVLDNSRTKVGKDFYDLFYKHWSALSSEADTSNLLSDTLVASYGDEVIVIEEIPSPAMTTQIMIRIDDLPVWQQFVQARYELLEEDALSAVDVVWQTLAEYREMQKPNILDQLIPVKR